MFRLKMAAILVAGSVLTVVVPASAQIIGENVSPNAQASFNTATAGTMALRAPGNVIARARADFRQQHASTITRSRFGPTIDEQPPEQTVDQQVRVQVIETLFTSLNTALSALNTALGGGAIPPGNGAGDDTNTDVTPLLGTISQPAS